MALSLTTKASSSLLLKRFSINLLQTFNFSTTQNPNSSTTSTTSDASEKPKPKKKRKKNLFDVAQFLPNWGIGCHVAKKHWNNVSYEITKINLYKSGGHGKAWGLAYVNGGFLWPNIKKLSDSLPQVGSKPTIQNLGISSVATRHFSSKGFRPVGSNFGSIRSSADWFHLLNKKKEWYLRLKKKKACRLLLKSQFLKKLHSSIQEKDLKDLDADKKFKYKKGCLGSSFAERNRMKRHFFHSGILNLYIKEKGMNDKNLNHPTQTRRSIDSSYKLSDLIYCCASSYQFSMKKREGRSKTKIKKIELPTHISEVNHKTLQAVISYAPTYSELPGYVKRRLGSGAVTTR